MEVQTNNTYNKLPQFSRLGLIIIEQRMNNPVNRKLRYGYYADHQQEDIINQEETGNGILQWIMNRVDKMLEEEVR